MAISQPGLSSPDFHPMGVAKMGFLVDQLNRDCSPLQFLREMTKNAIEAIERCGEPGDVRWDVDWNRFDLLGPDSAQKLCIIDNGVGMTGEEMIDYINKLSSSIHQQSATGNFGVGAKIAAAPLNPDGLVYLSWKDGVGSMIHLHRDQTSGDYGLLRFDNGEFWQKIQNDLKPDLIDQHGTMVVLLGRLKQQATIEPPAGVRMPRKWILRYINSRFFCFPTGLSVSVREGWRAPRTMPFQAGADRLMVIRLASGPFLVRSVRCLGVFSSTIRPILALIADFGRYAAASVARSSTTRRRIL